MIFFDDQMGNIQDVSQLGVTSVLTPRGVTRALFDKGLKSYANGERGVIIRWLFFCQFCNWIHYLTLDFLTN